MPDRSKFLRVHAMGRPLAQFDQTDATPIAKENTKRLIRMEPRLASILVAASELARRQAEELIEFADVVDDLYASLVHPGRRP